MEDTMIVILDLYIERAQKYCIMKHLVLPLLNDTNGNNKKHLSLVSCVHIK